MRAHDTHPAAYEAQLRAYRRMSSEQKAGLVLDLSEGVRQLAREGIRQRHPDYSSEQIRRAFIALVYGLDVAKRIWPEAPIPIP